MCQEKRRPAGQGGAVRALATSKTENTKTGDIHNTSQVPTQLSPLRRAHAEFLLSFVRRWGREGLPLGPAQLRQLSERGLTRRQVEAAAETLVEVGRLKIVATEYEIMLCEVKAEAGE